MTKAQYKQHLIQKQKTIVYESGEDEGAAEYHAEIQHVINAIDKGGSFEEIKAAAEWGGEPFLMKEGFNMKATKQEIKEQKHRCLAVIDNKQAYLRELKILRLMRLNK